MDLQVLANAVTTVPAGRWAVGVSGGADSMALLLLLNDRPDLSLHVAHLDHQTRAGESGEDAKFVEELARKLAVPCTIGLRSEIEKTMDTLLRNPSSRYRKARLAFFRLLVAAGNLQGVILAHHADDQAETVLLRILRGAGPAGLTGMRAISQVQGLKICRPLLSVSAIQLREYLQDRGQTWREDSSNQADKYSRNRIRKWLSQGQPCRVGSAHRCAEPTLHELQSASESLRDWLDRNAPPLSDAFEITALQNAPIPLAKHAAARWLVKQGAPPREVNNKTCERLVEMAIDAASSSKQDFPGKLRVRRRRGKIETV